MFVLYFTVFALLANIEKNIAISYIDPFLKHFFSIGTGDSGYERFEMVINRKQKWFLVEWFHYFSAFNPQPAFCLPDILNILNYRTFFR